MISRLWPRYRSPRGLSSLDLARKLVEHGADINARETREPNSDMEGRNSLNRFGATAFFLAAKSCDVPMMEAPDQFMDALEAWSAYRIPTAAAVS